MQAQTNLCRGSDFVIQLAAVWEEVKVVRGGGAARERQLRERSLRADEDVLRGHARPDGVERGQPIEEVGVLRCGQGAGEGLVEMMVSVHQPRKNDVAAQVQDFIRALRQVRLAADLLNEPIPAEKRGVF